MSIELSAVILALRWLNMCVCASMSPGSTYARLRSIVSAPAGIFTLDAAPTSVIRSPRMTMTWLASIWPDLLSNRWPARIAIVFGAGGQLKIPPSATHGVGPAPRHGAGGSAGPWAEAADATSTNPTTANTIRIGAPDRGPKRAARQKRVPEPVSIFSRMPRTPVDADAAGRS